MAAMKPRTGDGPLEVTKEGRGIVMRVPLEGGGRLVVEMTPDEANALGDALKAAAGHAKKAGLDVTPHALREFKVGADRRDVDRLHPAAHLERVRPRVRSAPP